jgi:hypothetical protein
MASTIAALALVLAAACTSSSHESKRAGGNSEQASGERAVSSDVKTEQTAGTDPGSAAVVQDGEEFEPGQRPVAITGVNLVDFDNARIRCDYRHTDTQSVYNAQCIVVVHQASGQEVRASDVKPGVDLSWQAPQAVRGTMSFSACEAATNQLAYSCSVKITDQTVLAEAAFTLQVSDAEHQPRTETSSLLLPYSVGIAAGFVPGMPYRYQGQIEAAPSGLALSSAEPVKVGYQQFDFPADKASFIFPMSLCLRGGDLYFVSGFSIYVASQGQVRLYAGSSNTRNTGNTTHRLRSYLMPQAIACTADAIYASSTELGQIFKLKDDGSMEVVAGTGERGVADDGAVAAKSPAGAPGSIAVDSKGNVTFVDFETGRARVVTRDGILKTILGPGSPNPDALLQRAGSIAVGPDDSIYIPDIAAHVVYRIDPSGKLDRIAGTGQARYQQASDPSALSEPYSVALDKAGKLYIGEAFRGVKKLEGNGLVQVTSAGPDIDTSADAMLGELFMATSKGQSSPYLDVVGVRPEFATLAIADDGKIYTDGPDGIYAFAPGSDLAELVVGTRKPGGTGCGSDEPAQDARFFEASALAVTPDKKIVVLDWLDIHSNQMAVRRLWSTDGKFYSRTIAGCASEPLLAAFNPTFMHMGQRGTAINLGAVTPAKDGSLYISNMSGNRIVKMDPSGALTPFAGTGANSSSEGGVPAASASFQGPGRGAFGPDGSFYFVELGPLENPDGTIGGKLRKISPDGILTTVAGNGKAGDSRDGDIAKDAPFNGSSFALAADGRIFFTETPNNKIKVIDTKGKIQVIAGGGSKTSDTDVIASREALLSLPLDIGVANDGTIYFLNFGTNQVMQLKQRPNSIAWDLSTFYGVKRTSDCGTSRVEGTSTSGQLTQAIKNSLSIICEGTPRAVAVLDTCPAEDGDTRIVISQTVGPFANIIEVVRPCAR